MSKILAQRGPDWLLIEEDEQHSRVYNRREHIISDPFLTDSILARGYWNKPELDEATRSDIEREVASLL